MVKEDAACDLTGDFNMQNLFDDQDKERYDFSNIHYICKCEEEFSGTETFLRGCKWSPNHACLASACSDHVFRFFLLTDVLNKTQSTACSPFLRLKPGGFIYDYAWLDEYSDKNRLRLLTATGLGPIHLWDVCKEKIDATYLMYDNVDEVTKAISICCSPSGDRIYGGTSNAVYSFRTDRPGRDHEFILNDKCFKRGIISAIAVNPIRESLLAVGSYNRRIGLYDEQSLLCVLADMSRGITHLKFSPNGTLLYSGMRGHGDILCWDLRNPGLILYKMTRAVETQQRIYFDMDPTGRYIISGSTDGKVYIWDTQSSQVTADNSLQPLKEFQAHRDCTNGVSINGLFPLLTTTSGQYHFDDPSVEETQYDHFQSAKTSQRSYRECSLKFWNISLN